MNHLKQYNLIIKNCKKQKRKKYLKTNKRYIYYENHHIISKCLGGNNNKENLVLLTAREHFICHKLLTYIYKGNKKIANAYCRMTWDKNGKRNISARDYAYAKELKASIPMSEKTKQKMRKPKGPMSEIHKQNIGKAAKGRKRTKESIKKQQETRIKNKKQYPKGRIPWNKGLTKDIDIRVKNMTEKTGKTLKGKPSKNKGKHRTEEQKEHLRIINTGKKQSKETIEKRKTTMGNPWNKGKKTGPLSESHKEKIRKSNVGKHGVRTEKVKNRDRRRV